MDNLESWDFSQEADCPGKSQDNDNIVVNKSLGWVRTDDEINECKKG